MLHDMNTTTAAKRNKCGCGAVISKYAHKCKACSAAMLAANAAVVATGKCPECGQALRRNLSLAGWWQCSGFGAEGFRATGSTKCSFQTFTE